jgi:NSS family neurotransmitter:Na+ symporter
MLFITLPELFYTVVPAGAALAPLFYLLVMFAALTSAISLLEVVVAYLIDERGMQRKPATVASICAVGGLSVLCALSLGAWSGASSFEVFAGKQGVLATLDHLVSNWLLPVGGLGITLAAGWFMTRQASEEELAIGAPSWFRYPIWRFFIRFVSPAAVAAILAAVMFFSQDFS